MPWDPDTDIGGPRGRFPSTRHSLLEEASGAGALSEQAVGQIAELYWKPVYKYIRLKWRKDNEQVKDLTQGFFTSALEHDFFARFDPGLASFRTYLRLAVDRFAASEHACATRRKRGGGVTIDPDAGLERADPAASPEEAFHREWQRQLFALAIDDLRAHCDREGKALQFRIFEEYDLADAPPPSYAELARRHGIAETTLNNHLAWARRTLRNLLAARLRGVTSGQGELRAEMRSALGSLR